jgi:predicted RNA-binding Zn ribbon-like protein
MVISDGHLHLDGAAPAFDLINSEYWYGLGPLDDRITLAGWRRGFLKRWGFAPLGAPTLAEQLELVALRTLLRRLVERAANGRSATRADVRALNQYLAHPAIRRVDRLQRGYELQLAPVSDGWGWVVAETAASFAELLADEPWRRVRVCVNDDCRFAFYDETKNSSRRWCAQTICGNRFKGRRFRERRRAARETG